LRHPSCTVVKTQICITCPQCVNTPGIFILLLSLDFKYANIFMEDTENLSINVLFLILHNTHAVFLCICTTYLLSVWKQTWVSLFYRWDDVLWNVTSRSLYVSLASLALLCLLYLSC